MIKPSNKLGIPKQNLSDLMKKENAFLNVDSNKLKNTTLHKGTRI